MENSFNQPASAIGERSPLFLEARSEKFPWLNIIMFILTCLSTLIVGAFLMAGFRETLASSPGAFFMEIWRSPSLLLSGAPFSLAIMSILLAHEMGHYLACRHYGISATLPYFIPAPTIVGTMGAFIRIRSPIQNRSALLDVGVAGPIAGFILAIPALFIALAQSRIVAPDPTGSTFAFGEPLIFKAVAAVMGKTPPAGMDLYLHPVGLAAWFGFFATAINLLPVGQLDGGHIAYALFRGVHKRISQGFIVCLIPFGIFYWPGWLVWTAILLFIGLRHPITLDDAEPLSRRHIWLGWFALIMFVLCFTPIPFYIT
jgi:membrane-associated protease RseP (regulator of RpoE activity)